MLVAVLNDSILFAICLVFTHLTYRFFFYYAISLVVNTIKCYNVQRIRFKTRVVTFYDNNVVSVYSPLIKGKFLEHVCDEINFH